MKISMRPLLAWIDKLDPGHLALKRSFKTFLAALISMAIFYKTPGMAMFAAIASMLFSRSQAGFTIQERRFTMLATGLTMTVLAVPVAVASQNQWVSLAYVSVAAFVVFFLIGNRVVPDFPVVSILALSVVEMAFAHDVKSGLLFAGMFVLNLTLVYTLHFIIWPTRPRNRIKKQIEITTKHLLDYHTAVKLDYPDAETGMLNTHDMSDRVRQSIGDFRRLWQLFRLETKNQSITEARYLNINTGLERIFEYLILLWQFRVSVWESDIFREKILHSNRLDHIIGYLFHRHSPTLIRPSQVKLQKMQEEINSTFREYQDQIKAQYSPENHAEWVSVINALKALETLVTDLGTPAGDNLIEPQGFSVSGKFKSFFKKLSAALPNLHPGNLAFRLAVRSMLIIGGTMAWSVFWQPDYGYWLVLFAVLLIRPNLGISIKVGKERVTGTVAGSILALGFIAITPAGSFVYLAFLLLNAFLMLWFININRMVPMVTFMTILIVGVFYLLYPDDGNLVWLRISYTAAIVLLVIVASFLIWPEKARKQFAQSLAGALELEKQFFAKTIDAVVDSNAPKVSAAEKQEIRNQIQRLNDTIQATKNEVLQERVIVHGMNIRSYIMRLMNTLQTLESISRGCSFSTGEKPLTKELQAFNTNVQKAFDALILALKTRNDVEEFPELRPAFEELRMQFRTMKYAQGEVSDNISQLWKNSTLIWIFKPLTLELEGIRKEINLKMKEV